ncbi:hypothetical protein RHMOL_Rhmol01G0165700 [Rhododendron molle]|uniref:Uncharacterized protein n=1 Tax=Rhododendron molle TaxID=49168 RepID=A0ACC0Q3M1_RHOML|nr:hypothetical protein RHMOL_Rhmol01G0165700 [Rhododendron molle]
MLVNPERIERVNGLMKSALETVYRWEFPVIGGYEYLVRLHFCDIASKSLNLLYFDVYVNGNLAYENLDLSSVTTMALASPFYADFVVNMESSGVLTVTVGPSNMSMSHTIDAILNGVEIMKLNNSMGSLDGEVCAASVLKNLTGRNTGGVVLLIAAMCLLVTALMVMNRRWVRVKNTVGCLRSEFEVRESTIHRESIFMCIYVGFKI